MIWILLSEDLGVLLYFQNNCVLFVYILLTQLGPLINKLNVNITIILEIESNFTISLCEKTRFKICDKEKMRSIVIKNHEFGSRDVIWFEKMKLTLQCRWVLTSTATQEGKAVHLL
jgi:hypothetical protein